MKYYSLKLNFFIHFFFHLIISLLYINLYNLRFNSFYLNLLGLYISIYLYWLYLFHFHLLWLNCSIDLYIINFFSLNRLILLNKLRLIEPLILTLQCLWLDLDHLFLFQLQLRIFNLIYSKQTFPQISLIISFNSLTSSLSNTFSFRRFLS